MSHAYHSMCGCASCCKVEQAEEYMHEEIEGRMNDPEWIAQHKAEADQWIDGSFDGDHYSALESAMADLAAVDPSDLMGSDLITRLYELAKVHGTARDAKLREMAEDEVRREGEP